MRRRTFLAAGSASVAGLSGCLGVFGGSGNGNYNTVDGQKVPLIPIDTVYEWYKQGNKRFVDARGQTQYRNAHIEGAVLSPAQVRGGEYPADDPVKDWSKTTEIVCYCGCPHHLSSIRASDLMANGYENVYVLDEGFGEWHDRNYPMAGSAVDTQPESWTIRGRTDPSFAGESAWAFHTASGQRQQEAAPIASDGSYALELHFYGLTTESSITVKTPGYRVEEPMSELVAGTVTG